MGKQCHAPSHLIYPDRRSLTAHRPPGLVTVLGRGWSSAALFSFLLTMMIPLRRAGIKTFRRGYASQGAARRVRVSHAVGAFFSACPNDLAHVSRSGHHRLVRNDLPRWLVCAAANVGPTHEPAASPAPAARRLGRGATAHNPGGARAESSRAAETVSRAARCDHPCASELPLLSVLRRR